MNRHESIMLHVNLNDPGQYEDFRDATAAIGGEVAVDRDNNGDEVFWAECDECGHRGGERLYYPAAERALLTHYLSCAAWLTLWESINVARRDFTASHTH